jgi:hypothetical protein
MRRMRSGTRTSKRGSPCDAVRIEIISLDDAPGYDSDRLVAQPLIERSVSNVRIIRLSPSQVLPPHRHGASDLDALRRGGRRSPRNCERPVGLGAGSIAFHAGDEEPRVSNAGQVDCTLLAFLAPPFPPRYAT